ncbi:SatD family protein [Salinibacterium sp. SYSU T00001]|uniref:SatD family protein n=1 Tax=Homoserinimonas sedimenticola TaxID=2986805 RepID=UPI0022366AC6|nr:SatD family protein [Salinibacterium sedimenticola]MCW4384804.1 SatD family protein [Salinibacterium sedimenticola]
MVPPKRAIAVIADLSKSRTHSDRAGLQRAVEDAFGALARAVPAEEPLQPTIGDEFQAVYADLPTAVRASLLARLSLPEGVDCRFGLGHGELRSIGEGAAGVLQDGSAWWSAREAIGQAREREYGRQPFVRTWFCSAEGAPLDDIAPAAESIVNAYLITRDHLVSAMSAREKRLLLGQLTGSTQAELAHDEGITQSAVSQNLRRSGAAAVLAGETLVAGGHP